MGSFVACANAFSVSPLPPTGGTSRFPSIHKVSTLHIVLDQLIGPNKPQTKQN